MENVLDELSPACLGAILSVLYNCFNRDLCVNGEAEKKLITHRMKICPMKF